MTFTKRKFGTYIKQKKCYRILDVISLVKDKTRKQLLSFHTTQKNQNVNGSIFSSCGGKIQIVFVEGALMRNNRVFSWTWMEITPSHSS